VNSKTSSRDAEFGANALRLQASCGPAWVIASAKDIPADLRRAAFSNRSKDFRYYEVLEESLREQFDCRYFVLHDEASGEWALQPFFFVMQDALGGLPAAARSLFAPIRRLWPGFLKMRMMMIGCAAGEGDLDHSSPWLAIALREAIDAYRRQARPSIILLKDFPSSYREMLSPFATDGYQRAPSMPAARLELDFPTFDEFMNQRLSKVFRKNLRRKLRASESGAPIELEVVQDATPFTDEIHSLYVQTFNRSDFKFEELNKEFFRLVGQRMPDRIRFFIWRQNRKIIAFNLCLIHDETLYDLGVGLDYAVALDLHLYFRTWRDVIEWCLKNGIKSYHTGPLNYDPKWHLRLTLVPLDLYARHNTALFNPLFKLAIKYLEPTRHDPILQRFPNAHQL
jgi:hypothetical protein